MISFLVFVCVVALVLINVPIAVALGIAAVAAILTTQGAWALPNVAITMFQGATSFPLIAIPLFILAGAIMNTSGISRRLIEFTAALLGSMRGALAQVNVMTSMFFAEISGSDTFVHAETPVGELVAQLTGVHDFAIGAPVRVILPAERCFGLPAAAP